MIGGILIALLGSGMFVFKSKESWKQTGAQEVRQSLQISPQPFQIDILKDTLVRKEDMHHFQNEIKTDVKDMRNMYQQLIITMNERDAKFRETIETVDRRMQESRTRIHEKINDHADRIKAVEVQSDIGKAIGQLGKAIIKSNTRSPQAT